MDEHQSPALARPVADGEGVHAVGQRWEQDGRDRRNARAGCDEPQLGQPVADDERRVRPAGQTGPYAEQVSVALRPRGDPALSRQLGEVDLRPARQAVARTDRDEQVALGEDLGGKRRVAVVQGPERLRRCHDHHVDGAGTQRAHHHGGGALAHGDPQVGPCVSEGAQRCGNETRRGTGEGPEPDRLGPRAVLALQLLYRCVQRAERHGGVAQEHLPGVGERDAPGPAPKERPSSRCLEGRGAPGDRRLCVAELARGGGEGSALSDGAQDEQVIGGEHWYAIFACQMC